MRTCPRENARAEGDGSLLSPWWNRTANLGELLIHDAADRSVPRRPGSGSPAGCPSASTAAGPTTSPWTEPSRPVAATVASGAAPEPSLGRGEADLGPGSLQGAAVG